MKKLLLITSCLLSIITPLKAQFTTYQDLKGYVILVTGDTIRGTIKQPEDNGLLRQKKVKFLDSTHKKTVYEPKDLKGYVIEAGGKTFPFESRQVDAHQYLLSKRVEGPMTLYAFYLPVHSYSVSSTSTANHFSGGIAESFFIERPNQHLEKFQLEDAIGLTFDFRARILEYVSDCLVLKEKIQSKELKQKDLEQIVSIYNQWWKEQDLK